MLIKKKIDPVALEVFKKHVEPVLPGLSKEERNLAYGFLIDPVEGFKEILKHYEISWHWHSDLEKLLEEGAKPPLLRMVKEYAEKKGWIKEDRWRGKYFIWERDLTVRMKEDKNGTLLPRNYWHYPQLKRIKECLEELKEKGVEEFPYIVAKGGGIEWSLEELAISKDLASKVLGRKVKEYEELTFEEALEIVEWLLKKWEKFMKEAKQKGLVWKDEEGGEHFIWEGDFFVHFEEDENGEIWPRDYGDLEELKKIKKHLEKLKQKGFEKLLTIFSSPSEDICWVGEELRIYYKLAETVLGKWKDLTLEEALKIVNWLYERWKTSGMTNADRKGCRSPGGRALLQVRRSRLGQAHRERKEAGGQIRGRSC